MGDESDASPELGHNVIGQLPMACHHSQISIASPQKCLPALQPSSFAPVICNPTPSMDGAVKVVPNFLKVLLMMAQALAIILSQCL